MKFLDTNVILRYLLWDDSIKAKECETLFKKLADNKESLFTSTLVITEVVWVLEKGYKAPKEKVISTVREIIYTPNLHLDEKEILAVALNIYQAENIDFIDAYNAAIINSKGISSIYSYDKHYDRLEGIKRIEP